MSLTWVLACLASLPEGHAWLLSALILAVISMNVTSAMWLSLCMSWQWWATRSEWMEVWYSTSCWREVVRAGVWERTRFTRLTVHRLVRFCWLVSVVGVLLFVWFGFGVLPWFSDQSVGSSYQPMTSLAYLHDCHSCYNERSKVQKKKARAEGIEEVLNSNRANETTFVQLNPIPFPGIKTLKGMILRPHRLENVARQAVPSIAYPKTYRSS